MLIFCILAHSLPRTWDLYQVSSQKTDVLEETVLAKHHLGIEKGGLYVGTISCAYVVQNMAIL